MTPFTYNPGSLAESFGSRHHVLMAPSGYCDGQSRSVISDLWRWAWNYVERLATNGQQMGLVGCMACHLEADAFPRQLIFLLLLLLLFFFFFLPFLACERTGQTLKLNSFFGCCTGVRLEAGITKLFPLKSRPFAKFFAVLELKQCYHAQKCQSAAMLKHACNLRILKSSTIFTIFIFHSKHMSWLSLAILVL